MKQTVDHEPGTVLPVAGRTFEFEVVGRHGASYRVTATNESQMAHCECEGFKHRGHCWHLAKADAFVAEGQRSAADAAVQWFMGLSEDEQKEIWR